MYIRGMRLWPSLLAFALLAGCTFPKLGSSSSGSPEPVRSEEIGLIGEWKGEIVETVSVSDGDSSSSQPERTPISMTFVSDKRVKWIFPKTSSSEAMPPELPGKWTVMGGTNGKPSKAELVMDMSSLNSTPSDSSKSDQKPESVTITFQLEWETDNDVIMTPTSGVSTSEGQLKDSDLQGTFHMSRVLK